MIKKFNLKLIVFIIACLYSSMLTAQINTPSGAVVPFNSNPNYGTNGIMPANLPSGGTFGKSQDAADAYNEWKANYIQACGSMYRVKFDDPSLTVSEGIGYGMQLAAYAADKTLFDGLYAYWKSFASSTSSGRTGKLMNWRISGCGPSVTGTGSAADADVDAAWALLIAATQWPNATSPYAYASEATNMMYSIQALELNSNGQLINGDGWGFGDNCRNPSYQSPAYYKTFATINTSNAAAWNTGVSGAYSLINANANASTGLISDWSDPNGVRNTCNPGGLGYAATNGYGYDACRNPWRMAQDVLWNNDASAKAICTKIAAYLNGRGSTGNVGGPLNQDGSNYSGYAHNATFVSTFATAVMGSTNQTLMNSMYAEVKNTKDVIQNQTLSGYFGNTLRCVSLFMMTGNFWKYGTTSFQDINVRQATVNVPSTTTYDFQNQQTIPPATSGKAVTFTIENLGFAALNLTGGTKVAVSGPDAALFTVVQPTVSTLALSATTTFTVTFTPTTAGTKNAVLTIANNDPDAVEAPYIINIKGTGTANATAPKMAVYDTTNLLASGAAFPMGAFSVSTVGNKLIKVTNTGDAPLNLNSATFTGTNPTAFSILNVVGSASVAYPIIVPIGGTKYISIGYTAPAAATSSSAILTFATTDPNAPSYVLNLTASAAACSATPASNILDDYDGNVNVKLAFTPTGAFSQAAVNQFQTGLNLSPTVASYVRATTGTYDIIRYYNCGTAGTTYVPFNLTAANPTIQMLVYSPAVGITITVAPQKPSTTTPVTWLPLIADYSSNITVVTTKANQWELLTFDMSKILAAGVQADFKSLDIQIDPLLTYAGAAANAAASARTFYLDQIKYGINPCVNDLSGILEDYDAHNNLTLDYANAALVAPAPNPSSTGLNTSANVGQFTKTINAATYDDGFRYDGCGNKIDLSTKKYISMLVYSPVANAAIQISAKVPDGADADAYPDDAAANTQLTVFANKWHRLYFDLSTISAANLPNVFGIDIFFDPNDVSGVTSGSKFYFDDIRLESALPCVAGIPATNILNDFENNRYLGVSFPAAPAFNTIKANPVPTGINTSAIVGEFTRGTAATGTSVRFAACQGQLDLTPGHNLIDLKVYSPNAKVAIVMSLKNAAGVSLSDVTDTIQVANTWTNLRFDHTNIINSTAVAFIDIIVDPNAVFSGATSTVGARTYEFDDLQYAPPAPEINVKALTTPTTTDVPTTGSFSLGSAAIGDSTLTLTFSIQNNGLQTLNLTGTPTLKLAGANPTDFVIATTQTFTTSVGALGATGFSIYFKPGGTTAGARSASLTIINNDSDEGTYVIYLNANATVAKLAVLDGSTASAPVILTNNTPAINVGTSAVGVAATPAYTMSIKNTGIAPLKITSVTPSAGFTVTALTPTGSIASGAIATFTITGTPAATGLNAGTLTIVSNDPATPSYKVNITVTGSVPVISVLDATSTVVASNNTTAVSVGSGPVGTAVTPAYVFTIKNTGSAPLTITSVTPTTGFTVTAVTPTGAIAIGANATFTVTGTPAAAGVNTGSVTIVSNDPITASYKVNVTVTGTVPVLQVLNTTTALVNNATPAISVGTATVATAAPAYTSFSIKNTGTGPLTLTSITGSTGFVVSAITPAAPATIAVNGTATFTVTGTPAAVGANTGTITIVTNDPTTASFKINVSVTGTAAATPALQVLNTTAILANNATPAISVGSAVTGSPATAYTSFSIKNAGTAALTFTSITGSAGFAISAVTPAAPTTIAAGATATFTVTGTPATTGTNTGTITIVTNDPTTASFVINVTVTGTAAPVPALQVLNTATAVTNNNTPAISVGTAVVGSPATAYTAFSIKNTGTAALTLTSITGSAGFAVSAVTPSTPATIAAGGTATFTVTGTPAAAGTNTGTITIVTNDPTTSSFKVNVTVTGTAVPALQVLNTTTVLATNNTPAISIGSAVIGSPATAYTSFSIKNTGSAALSLTSITGSAGFAISAISPAAPATIAIGATATFTVTGTPAASGTNTGTITIVTNDPTTASFVINVAVTGTAASTPAVQVLNTTAILTTNNTPAISVGSASVGTAATAYTSFSVKNVGSAALSLTSITGSAGFAVSAISPATPATIAVGATATFTVTGTPAAVGANTGTITIATNDPTTASFIVNVSVTGTVPAVQVLNSTTVLAANSTPAISVGSAVTGSPATAYTSFSVKNTGTGALTLTSITGSAGFAVSAITPAAPATIAAGATATFTVTGTPAAAGSNAGTITIVTNDPTTPSFKINVTVTGTAAPAPAVQVLNSTTVLATNNTPSISVGSAVTGSPATAYTSFSVKNTGNAALSLTSITGSAGFAVSAISPAAPTTIAAGATVTFTVTGTPAAAGVNAGTITIATNDPTTASFVINVTVTGTAAPAPALQVLNGGSAVTANNAPAISVGSAVVGSQGNGYTSFSIKNTGSAPLSLTSITGSAGFAISAITPSAPATIAANGTATFTVKGTPSVSGTNTGTITIATNDPTTQSFVINVAVTGTAAPQATVTIPGVTNNGTAVSIGSAVVGNPTAPYTFTISNTGSLPLNVGTITSSNPDFVVTQVTPNPIPAGGTGTFTVTATPSAIGTSTGAITIPSNDPGSPFVINVSAIGTGTPTGASLQLKGKSNQIVANNSSFIIGANTINTPTAPYTFTITNIGGANLTIANIIATSGFSATQPFPATIAAGASQTFTVTGVPNDASATRWGTITIMSNDAATPLTLNVGVNVGTPTGVRALTSTDIQMFPNPTTLGYSNIEFNGSFDDVVVTVYSADGSKAFTKDYSSVVDGDRQLEVQDLPAGVYFVEVATAQGKIIQRLIKQ
jgi:endo-1,4-beta-D-glucanase Y